MILAGAAALGFEAAAIAPAAAATRSELDREGRAALAKLYAATPKARELGGVARGVLVFPKILKAGLMVGGLGGEGVLFEKGHPNRYFNTFAGSFGFQAGAQTYEYVLFFITASGLQYLKRSQGWAIGSGPSVVVLDQGLAKSISSTTLTQDVYAMVSGQSGLMAGVGIEGSKITEIHPSA